MAAEPEIVRGWLKQIGLLTVATMDRREFALRVEALVPALAEEFPTRAFTNESVRVVARECPHGLPTFAEVIQVLSPWWKQHRPSLPEISTDGPADRLLRAEAERAAEWAAITPAQIRQRIQELENHPMADELGRILASAIRRYATAYSGLLPPKWLAEPAGRRATTIDGYAPETIT